MTTKKSDNGWIIWAVLGGLAFLVFKNQPAAGSSPDASGQQSASNAASLKNGDGTQATTADDFGNPLEGTSGGLRSATDQSTSLLGPPIEAPKNEELLQEVVNPGSVPNTASGLSVNDAYHSEARIILMPGYAPPAPPSGYRWLRDYSVPPGDDGGVLYHLVDPSGNEWSG